VPQLLVQVLQALDDAWQGGSVSGCDAEGGMAAGGDSPRWCSSFRSSAFATRLSYSWIGPMSSTLAAEGVSVWLSSRASTAVDALFSTVMAATADARLLWPAAKVAGNTTRGAAVGRRLACGRAAGRGWATVWWPHAAHSLRWRTVLGGVRSVLADARRSAVPGGRRRRLAGMAVLDAGGGVWEVCLCRYCAGCMVGREAGRGPARRGHARGSGVAQKTAEFECFESRAGELRVRVE
jgi:hypothetical protein